MLSLLKLGAKLLLSRLPAQYALWQRMGIFRHGSMDSCEYALAVVALHLGRVQALAPKESFVALEIGPGDSVAAALIAKCYGARKVYLVDSGDYATRDMKVYRSLWQTCKAQGLAVPGEIRFDSFDEFLRSCNAEYLTHGLESLRSIPARSVDVVWSHAVLEHVRLDEFEATLDEFRRVLAPAGIQSHRVDLRDHLSGGLDNLRFSHQRWETDLFRNSGFYTNRIRFDEMLKLFRRAGFSTAVSRTETWPTLPLPQHKMAEPFRSLPESELLVSGFDITSESLDESSRSPGVGELATSAHT